MAAVGVALILGGPMFGEHPDPLMSTGAALIVGAGLCTFWRETGARPRPVPAGAA